MKNSSNKKALLSIYGFFLLLPLAVQATIWHVDDDNLTGTQQGSKIYPFNQIQPAIKAAAQGDTIRVAAGLYKENISINKRLNLIGGYPGGTGADYTNGNGGNFNNRDFTRHDSHVQAKRSDVAVLRLRGVQTGETQIDGLHFSGGLRGIEFNDTDWVGNKVTITNNFIENNGMAAMPDHGGGMLVCCGNGHRLINNKIKNNHAGWGGGVFTNATLNLLFSKNTVTDNQGHWDHGGGLWFNGTGTIIGNLIYRNKVGHIQGYGWGGGLIVVGEGTDFIIRSNKIRSNYAYSIGGGIFIDEGAHAVLKNNLIVKNRVTEYGGAGIYVDGGGNEAETPDSPRSHVDIINCTIAHNTGGWVGGNGVYVQVSDVTVRNSIFWGNSPGDYGPDFFTLNSNATLAVGYTLSKQPYNGIGNIRKNPLFADKLTNDYHLKSTAGRWDIASRGWVADSEHSPAIDAGDPSSAYSSEPSPNGGRINLGYDGNTRQASQSQ